MINLFNYLIKKKHIESTPSSIYQAFELSINKAAALAKDLFCLEREQPSKAKPFFLIPFQKKPKKNPTPKKCLIIRVTFITCITLGIVYFQPRIFKFISSSFRKNNISYLEKIKIQTNKASQNPIIVIGVGLVAFMGIASLYKALNYKCQKYGANRRVIKLKKAQDTFINNKPMAFELYEAAQKVYLATLKKTKLNKKEDTTGNNELLLAAENAYNALLECRKINRVHPNDLVKVITKLAFAAENVYYALLKTDANDDDKLKEAQDLVCKNYREAIFANQDLEIRLNLIKKLKEFNVIKFKRDYTTLISNKPDQESEPEITSYNEKLIKAAKDVYQAISEKMQANQEINEEDNNELIVAAKNVYKALLKTSASAEEKTKAADDVFRAYKDAIEVSTKAKLKKNLTENCDQFVEKAKQELGLSKNTDTSEVSAAKRKKAKQKKKRSFFRNFVSSSADQSPAATEKKNEGFFRAFFRKGSQIIRRKRTQ